MAREDGAGWIRVQSRRLHDHRTPRGRHRIRNASDAERTGGALRDIGSYGQWPLAIIAVGLIAYGIYQLVNARYRVIPAV
ncbi:MAG: DUF1206 domain-containing protein [Thermoanaerobaculia bacterium]|nr:DUF1206 domain-containing protein [Thermoanaerobaculia bacterium]